MARNVFTLQGVVFEGLDRELAAEVGLADALTMTVDLTPAAPATPPAPSTPPASHNIPEIEHSPFAPLLPSIEVEPMGIVAGSSSSAPVLDPDGMGGRGIPARGCDPPEGGRAISLRGDDGSRTDVPGTGPASADFAALPSGLVALSADGLPPRHDAVADPRVAAYAGASRIQASNLADLAMWISPRPAASSEECSDPPITLEKQSRYGADQATIFMDANADMLYSYAPDADNKQVIIHATTDDDDPLTSPRRSSTSQASLVTPSSLVLATSATTPSSSLSLAPSSSTPVKKNPVITKMKLAARKDAPKLNIALRGSLTKALAAGSSHNRAATLKKLKDDQFARSGKGPRSSRWSTWKKLHKNWMGDTPVLPLTVDSIAAVLGQLKEGQYRSADDYMSTAKDHHLVHHEWSSRLARQQRVCVRSALRGIGPSHQCGEILLDDFADAATKLANDERLPVGFANTGVLSYFFCLRELELSTMVATSVSLDTSKQIVSILLPSTKVDVMALSCTRSWGCVCDEDIIRQRARCPYHVAKSQLELIRAMFGDLVDSDGFPFSPGRDGKPMTKERMIKAIQVIAQQLGLPLIAMNGRLAFTGHVFRISGSRHLARIGVQIASIMLLARWAGWIIAQYVKDAPLAGLASEYKKGKRIKVGAQDDRKTKKIDKLSTKALDTIKTLESEIRQQEEKLEQMVKDMAIMDRRIEAPYIVSDKYQVWHVVFPWLDAPVKAHKTHCGWSYGRSVYQRRVEVPEGLPRKPLNKHDESLCPRCFPDDAVDDELDDDDAP